LQDINQSHRANQQKEEGEDEAHSASDGIVLLGGTILEEGGTSGLLVTGDKTDATTVN
jgi:hypothetical protein